jgi:hypothetical protein
MSYRNPKVYAVDPLAFTKGFNESFKNTFTAFQAVGQQIKAQREKDDMVMAELLKYGNIGALDGVSKEVNTAIQQSIYGLVDKQDFVEMTAVQRAEKLMEIDQIKSGIEQFVSYYSISPEDLSERSMINNPNLHNIINQIKLDPSSVSITGDINTLDVNLSYTDKDGKTYKTSMRDMNKFTDTYKSIEKDKANFTEFINGDITNLQRRIDTYAVNLGRENAKGEVLENYFNETYGETMSEDMKAYIYYELLDDNKKKIDLDGQTFTAYNLGGEDNLSAEDKAELRQEQDRLIKDTYKEILSDRLFATPTKPPGTKTPGYYEQIAIDKENDFKEQTNSAVSLIDNNAISQRENSLTDKQNFPNLFNGLTDFANNLGLQNTYSGQNAPNSVIDNLIISNYGNESYKLMVKNSMDPQKTEAQQNQLELVRNAIRDKAGMVIEGELIRMPELTENSINQSYPLGEELIRKILRKYNAGGAKLTTSQVDAIVNAALNRRSPFETYTPIPPLPKEERDAKRLGIPLDEPNLFNILPNIPNINQDFSQNKID